MMKKRIVVVCPGRGSYTKETLGYLHQSLNSLSVNKKNDLQNLIQSWDEKRLKNSDPSLTQLDQATEFKASLHLKGEHASPLIYACSLSDFESIDSTQYEVVALCGNSMGWYLALAMSKALSYNEGYFLVQTMGSMMRERLIGGQLIYPIMDDQWLISESEKRTVLNIIQDIHDPGEDLYLEMSIELGGYLVIGGSTKALSLLMQRLPKKGDYPIQLLYHGAFHTSLLKPISDQAFHFLPLELFRSPKIPLIDGQGRLWGPYSTEVHALRSYTLADQVFSFYNFSKSIEVALKEFAPDHLVLLGPGSGLGAVLGQILVSLRWQGIKNKYDFQERQKKDPFLISMGLENQKKLLLAH